MKEWLIAIVPVWTSATGMALYYWGYRKGRKRGWSEIPPRRK